MERPARLTMRVALASYEKSLVNAVPRLSSLMSYQVKLSDTTGETYYSPPSDHRLPCCCRKALPKRLCLGPGPT
jgi:hypothetical protein